MSELHALWFDASSPEARSFAVGADDESLWLLDDAGGKLRVSRSDATLLTPPDAPRPVLQTAGGAQLVLPSDRSVERLAIPSAAISWTERASRSNLAALSALAALAVMLLATLGWLVPRASALAAHYLPWSAEVQLRDDVLRTVDRAFLKPSGLSSAEKLRIRARFEVLAQAAGIEGVRLEFRDGAIVGANALAVPGKVVVVTDQLVDLLGESRQLDAVLAHELGHVHHRHGLQVLMRRAGFSVVISTLLLDQGLLQRVAELAPQALLSAAHSREAEREADAFAFGVLERLGGSPRDFADAIAQLEKQRGDRSQVAGYLNSHPPSAERIEAATKAR